MLQTDISSKCITSRPYIFEPTEESGNLSNFFIKVMYSLMSPLSSELGCQMQKQPQITVPPKNCCSKYKYIDQLHRWCQIWITMHLKTLSLVLMFPDKGFLSSMRSLGFQHIVIQIWHHFCSQSIEDVTSRCTVNSAYNHTNKALLLTLAAEGGDKNKDFFALTSNYNVSYKYISLISVVSFP